NLISQLREADALDRLDEVLTEIPRTRKELGSPPLVTPMSQMIGSQAVSNVLFGRYKMMSDQVKDYAYGMYGRSPAPLDPDVMEMALKGYERGSEPFTGKPADLIEPEMEQAREAIKDISTDVEDVLTYALFPSTGLKFLRMKHGLDPIPENMKPKSLEQVEQEIAKGAYPVKKKAVEAPPKSSRARTFNVYVEGDFFEVEVDPVQSTRSPASGVASPSAPAPYQAPAPATPSTPAASQPASGESTIGAPMPGILLRYIAEVGQSVQAGDPILVLEAMKMENTLPSPITGIVKELPFGIGVTVAKDDILAIIAP
ncbi:MAG: carboxylase, partial [Chloroflexi bacterium]|nr:carboxylase [Chloroflexota bacterium]